MGEINYDGWLIFLFDRIPNPCNNGCNIKEKEGRSMNHSSYCMMIRSLYPLWGLLGEAALGIVAKPLARKTEPAKQSHSKTENGQRVVSVGYGAYRIERR